MRGLIVLTIICCTTVLGQPSDMRIVGGSLTTIQRFPFAAIVMMSRNQADYTQACGGVILNDRSVLSAAHCFYETSPNNWRIRVGSSIASNGGSVHSVAELISHPNFEFYLNENDIGIYRVSTSFKFGGNIRPGRFAGAQYVVGDNTSVITVGWGATSILGPLSNQLRQVQVRTVNQDVCQENYNSIGMSVIDTMICAGNLYQGGQDPCSGDFGGPLLHNGNVIGIASWGSGCGYAGFPAVYTRVPKFIDWIQSNA